MLKIATLAALALLLMEAERQRRARRDPVEALWCRSASRSLPRSRLWH